MVNILDYLTPDIIGWVGNIGFVIGCALLAKNNIKGWHWNFMGNSAYVIVGLWLNLLSVVILSIYLMTINIIGIKSWKKKQKENQVVKLPATEVAVLAQIKEFLKHIRFFAGEKFVESFDEFDKLYDKYKGNREELSFYDVRTKNKFKTSNYTIHEKGERHFAVAKSPAGTHECWRVLSKNMLERLNGDL